MIIAGLQYLNADGCQLIGSHWFDIWVCKICMVCHGGVFVCAKVINSDDSSDIMLFEINSISGAWLDKIDIALSAIINSNIPFMMEIDWLHLEWNAVVMVSLYIEGTG